LNILKKELNMQTAEMESRAKDAQLYLGVKKETR
jgi:hypothetical protein